LPPRLHTAVRNREIGWHRSTSSPSRAKKNYNNVRVLGSVARSKSEASSLATLFTRDETGHAVIGASG
jgi:hypothetical protein